GVCFFQAEDGIRDFHVTGVQTCALPISAEAGAAARGSSTMRTAHARSASVTRERPDIAAWACAARKVRYSPKGSATPRARAARRSEERRGGEEGRAEACPRRQERDK